jgi:hypothetical protein
MTIEITKIDSNLTPRPNGEGSVEGANDECLRHPQDRVSFSMSIDILYKTDAPI